MINRWVHSCTPKSALLVASRAHESGRLFLRWVSAMVSLVVVKNTVRAYQRAIVSIR